MVLYNVYRVKCFERSGLPKLNKPLLFLFSKNKNLLFLMKKSKKRFAIRKKITIL